MDSQISGHPERSTPEDKNVLLSRLRNYLETIDYLNLQNPEHVWREIASVFRQRDWTRRELNLLISIIHKGQSRYLSVLRALEKK